MSCWQCSSADLFSSWMFNMQVSNRGIEWLHFSTASWSSDIHNATMSRWGYCAKLVPREPEMAVKQLKADAFNWKLEESKKDWINGQHQDQHSFEDADSGRKSPWGDGHCVRTWPPTVGLPLLQWKRIVLGHLTSFVRLKRSRNMSPVIGTSTGDSACLKNLLLAYASVESSF